MPQVPSIKRSHIQRLLLVALGASAVLLLSALLVAIRTVRQIDANTQTFADGQQATKGAIDGIEKQQAALNGRWVQLAKKDLIRREEILSQLTDSRQQMSNALESAYEQAEMLRESIYQEGHGLLRFTVWLFALCVGLSLLCATWVVRASAGLFRRLEQQAAELSQLQYQFLETQENVARRFSHELHDELGQALTAVKANLSALRDQPTPDQNSETRRLDDCMSLVDGAIKDVREMSQLLRPTILDDFGLDAALRSLTENFALRTGIAVQYRSDLKAGRLRDEAETHLYRIAQEALTNVARHSGATEATLHLLVQHGDVTLRIADNGRGFGAAKRRSGAGLGLAGMETRARGCGGRLEVNASEGKGVSIEVTCPAVQSSSVA
ncbi:MAG TPA: sensor histidine kinase [Bryobacteraceae bacterium]|nr:sensor histidine kinase [Bryobacteraceae bacterium]